MAGAELLGLTGRSFWDGLGGDLGTAWDYLGRLGTPSKAGLWHRPRLVCGTDHRWFVSQTTVGLCRKPTLVRVENQGWLGIRACGSV
jgi:hypothetical protein